MTLDDAQKLADQALIAALQGSLDNVSKVRPLRRRLAREILASLEVNPNEDAAVLADRAFTTVANIFAVSNLPETVIKDALASMREVSPQLVITPIGISSLDSRVIGVWSLLAKSKTLSSRFRGDVL